MVVDLSRWYVVGLLYPRLFGIESAQPRNRSYRINSLRKDFLSVDRLLVKHRHQTRTPLTTKAPPRAVLMAAMSISRISPRNWPFAQSDLVFPFLAPAVQSSRSASPHISTARFSTSSPLWKRDNNRNRGVSALRRTGPRRRQTLSVLKEPLPVPVLDPKQKSTIEGDPDHGLWEFFGKNKELLTRPEDELAHGMRN